MDRHTEQIEQVASLGGQLNAIDWNPVTNELLYGGASDTGQPLLSIVQVINASEPPVAEAGEDQTSADSDNTGSELVTLHGEASSDTDGTIVSYLWMEVIGGNITQIATSATPSVKLSVGVHIITLTVTDDDGLTDEDEVVITVLAPRSTPMFTPTYSGAVLFQHNNSTQVFDL